MRLWVRADGSATIGLGHLSRCTAIAEAATARGVETTFVTTDDASAVHLLTSRGHAPVTIPAADDRSWLERVDGGDAVVLDGYHLTEADAHGASDRGATVAAIDDRGRTDLTVDVLVDPNDPDVDRYAGARAGRVLAGPTYALVRSVFTTRRRLRSGPAGALLLTFGGSDARALGPAIVDALDVGAWDEVVLVEGSASRPVPDPPSWLTVVRDPDEIADVFDRADAAIAAAGSSTWELLAMGVPTALAAIADNQAGILRTAVGAGAAVDAGDPADLGAAATALTGRLTDVAVRRSLSTRAMDLVDGGGPDRVVDALLSCR